MTTNGDSKHQRAVIGTEKNFWKYSSRDGFDLTRNAASKAPPSTSNVTIETKTTPITVDPAKSALVIIDMQNFFLSEAFGRKKGAGHAALEQLVEHAIPAARKAGIRIIWLNWGLTDEEVSTMPPAVTRSFGFEMLNDDVGVIDGTTIEAKTKGPAANKHGSTTLSEGSPKSARYYKGLGSECGVVEDPSSGKEINAGPLLMRGAWNSALYPPLDKAYEEGKQIQHRPDVWIHKNRMSGMWGVKTECEDFLENEGIKTLFFTGVNTDQCVGGTLTDSFSKGYDCILLNDGAATSSPGYAQQCFEFNAANTFGFATTCKALADGVEKMSS